MGDLPGTHTFPAHGFPEEQRNAKQKNKKYDFSLVHPAGSSSDVQDAEVYNAINFKTSLLAEQILFSVPADLLFLFYAQVFTFCQCLFNADAAVEIFGAVCVDPVAGVCRVFTEMKFSQVIKRIELGQNANYILSH